VSMFVTQSSLVGYTLVNGTASIQFALLLAAIYNVAVYPDLIHSSYFDGLTHLEKKKFEEVRFFWIPGTHATMAIINFIVQSKSLDMDGIKSLGSFLGMILYTTMLLQTTKLMFYFPQPIDWKRDRSVSATYLWFEI
jgi:hypothetical protein